MTNRFAPLRLALVCSLGIFAFAPAANANLVLNGGFQDGTPVLGSPGYEQVDVADSNPMPNWTVTAGNLDWIHGYWAGSSNSLSDYSVDLSGVAQVTVQQLITGLVTNQWYSLTFDTALNPDNGDTSQNLAWSLGGLVGDTADGTTDPDISWTSNVFSFLWTGGTSAVLAFSSMVPSDTNCCWGPALDNVALNAIPLPAALPLLAAGLGAMGYLARRRKHRPTFAA